MKLKHIFAIGLLAAPTAALAGPALNGAGATFPAPLYQRWFQDYARTSGSRVNYQSVGSGAGVRNSLRAQLTSQQVTNQSNPQKQQR